MSYSDGFVAAVETAGGAIVTGPHEVPGGQLDCPGHRSAGCGLFPGRRQIEESNDEQEHDLPVVRP